MIPTTAAAAAAGVRVVALLRVVWPIRRSQISAEGLAEWEMRHWTLVVIAATACLTAPSFARGKPKAPATGALVPPSTKPTFDECYRLGWVRGVHVERGEWEDFYEQCLAGRVPFNSGMSADSVIRDLGRSAPRY